MESWDDLRFFLSVAAHGSTMAASTEIKTSQSTVFRRIGSLEEALGVTLFDRRPFGYTLTPAGAVLLPLARQIEQEMTAFRQAANREAHREMTVIRFSVPDAALEFMLPSIIAAFRARYPEIRIEVVESPRQLDLASGEADVAFRSNPSSDPELFGRRLAEERPQLAASSTYAERHPLPATEQAVADHSFINPTGVLATALADWMVQNVPPQRVLLHPESVTSALAAVRSGIGIGVLPQFIVDRDPLLVAAPLALPIKPFELWIVTHQRRRRAPPVRFLMDLVASYVLDTTPARSPSAS